MGLRTGEVHECNQRPAASSKLQPAPAAIKKENNWGEFCQGSDASQAPKIIRKKRLLKFDIL